MSNPRIIAGKAKGIRLKSVPGDVTRPIMDRVKESLFNILGTDIIEASLLDLFGGTGSVGIEALSRGAQYVRFIDNNRGAINTIKDNLQHTKLEANSDVVFNDAFAYLSKTPDRQFDYIYIAPPQYKQLWQRAVTILDSHPDWLAPGSWVIVQIDPVEYEQIECKNFIKFDERRYGSTLLIFYETPPPE